MSESGDATPTYANPVHHHHKIRIKLGALEQNSYVENVEIPIAPSVALSEEENVDIGSKQRIRTISDEDNNCVNNYSSSDQSSATPAPENLFHEVEQVQQQLSQFATPNITLQNYLQQFAAAAAAAAAAEQNAAQLVEAKLLHDDDTDSNKSLKIVEDHDDDARSEDEPDSGASLSISAPPPTCSQADNVNESTHRRAGSLGSDSNVEQLSQRNKKRKQSKPQMHHLSHNSEKAGLSQQNVELVENLEEVDTAGNNNSVRSCELTPNRMMKRTVSSSLLTPHAMMASGMLKRASLPHLIIDEDDDDEKEGYEVNAVMLPEDDQASKVPRDQQQQQNVDVFLQQQTAAIAQDVLARQTANMLNALRWSLPNAPAANNSADPNVRVLFDTIKEQMHASLDTMVEEILRRLSTTNEAAAGTCSAPKSLNFGSSSSSSSTHSAANSSTGGGGGSGGAVSGTHTSSDMMMNVSTPSETHSTPPPISHVMPANDGVRRVVTPANVEFGQQQSLAVDSLATVQQLSQQQQQALLAANLPLLANLMPNGLPPNLTPAQAMDFLSQRLMVATSNSQINPATATSSSFNVQQIGRPLTTLNNTAMLQHVSPLPAMYSSQAPNNIMPRFFSPTLLHHHRNESSASDAAAPVQNNQHNATIASLLQRHHAESSSSSSAMPKMIKNSSMLSVDTENSFRNVSNKKKPKVTDSRIMPQRLISMNNGMIKTQQQQQQLAATPTVAVPVSNHQQQQTFSNANNSVTMSLANNNMFSGPAATPSIAQLQSLIPQNNNNNNAIAALMAAAQQQQQQQNSVLSPQQHQQQLLLQQLHLQAQQQQQQKAANISLLNNHPVLQAAAAAGLPITAFPPAALAAMLQAANNTASSAITFPTTTITTPITSAFQQQQQQVLLNGGRPSLVPSNQTVSISHLENMLRGVVSAAGGGSNATASLLPHLINNNGNPATNGAQQVALIAANLEQHLRQAAAAANSNSSSNPTSVSTMNMPNIQQHQMNNTIKVELNNQPQSVNNNRLQHQQLRSIIQQQQQIDHQLPTQAPPFNSLLSIQQQHQAEQANHHRSLAHHRRHQPYSAQQQRDNGATSSAAGSLPGDAAREALNSPEFGMVQRGTGGGGGGGGGGSEGGTNRHQMTAMTPMHLRKAKLMFFYNRYPNSTTLKTFFPDIRFNKQNTAQLVKWFSNFREFYYQQIEKQARNLLQENITCADDFHVSIDSELFRSLNQHYNRNNHMPVPEYFRTVIEETLKEFFRAIQDAKDQEPSWKKQIYKVIARLDCAVPDYFKHPQFLERLE